MRRTPAWPPPIQIAGTPVASLAWTTSVLETRTDEYKQLECQQPALHFQFISQSVGFHPNRVETARSLALANGKSAGSERGFSFFIRLTLGRSRCPVLTAMREAPWQSAHRSQQ